MDKYRVLAFIIDIVNILNVYSLKQLINTYRSEIEIINVSPGEPGAETMYGSLSGPKNRPGDYTYNQ